MTDRTQKDRRREQQQRDLDARITRAARVQALAGLPPTVRASLEQSMRDVAGAQVRLDAGKRSEKEISTALTARLEADLGSPSAMQEIASSGVHGSGQKYPHLAAIQAQFGHHDISGLVAHRGADATSAAEFLGAHAYAYGDHVAFGDTADLWTAAHEAAHVVQQRAGISIAGGVGATADRYEQHADAVADRVVRGKSADVLLNEVAAAPSHAASVHSPVVQRSDDESAFAEAIRSVVGSAVEYVVDAAADMVGFESSSSDSREGSDASEVDEEKSAGDNTSTKDGAEETRQSPDGVLSTAEQEQLVQWIESGRTDVNPMVDEFFFARHPESRGTALAPGSDLANEWMQIHAVVKRAVDMSPQNKSGATGDFEVTPEVEARAEEAIRAHMATYETLPDWSYQSNKKHSQWLLDLRDKAFFAGFPDAKGREKESGYSAAWKVIAEGVVPRTLNSIYTDGQDPTLATNEVEEGTEVGLTDIDCDSPRLRELLGYERLPQDLTAEAHELIGKEPAEKQPAQYEALQSKVFYANQRDNAAVYEGKWGGTCNLTSLAMAMQAAGIPSPDASMQYEEALLEVAAQRGVLGSITSSSAWDEVVKASGGKSKLVHSGDKILEKSFWVDTVQKQYLQKGWGVIMSLAGHIVRLEAVTDTGLRVDDPFGASTIGHEEASSSGKYYRISKNSDDRDRGAADYNKGENIVYPWTDVENHKMRSIYAVQAKGRPRRRKDSLKAAAHGVSGSGRRLPFSETIQPLFGRHKISGVRAHVGGRAATAAEYIGAQAYASGQHIAFQKAPDLHTAAHEAAHIIQQRGGVSLQGGVGRAGDSYERHADAVADLVVQGKSAEALLDTMSGVGSASTSAPVVQRLPADQTMWSVPASSNESTGESSRTSTEAAPRKSSVGFMDILHGALDAAGMFPALGVIPDGINALIYVAEGDMAGAGFSAAAMVPIFGQGATATKYTVKVGGELVERTAVRVTKEGVEQMGQEGIEQGLKRAKSSADGVLLRKSLRSEELLSELAAGGGKTIAGAGHKTPIRDVNRLVAEYGGDPSDWAKISSRSAVQDGTRIEIHAYRNIRTGQMVEPKTKLFEPVTQ